MAIYLLGMLTIIIPATLILWLTLSTTKNKLDWVLRSVLVSFTVFIFYKIGLWSLTSYYLRYILLFLFAFTFLYSLSKNINTPYNFTVFLSPVNYLLLLFTLASFILSVFILKGSTFNHSKTIGLSFPFAQGKYLVLQGGSNFSTNPFHNQASSASYALDIIKLNRLGNRATQLFPEQLKQYNIFNEEVLSPCTGTVQVAVDNQIDNPPGHVNTKQPAGNHLILLCDDVKIFLAHLQQNSLRVSEGEHVRTGQSLAMVGNSGFTDEPHLHLQANDFNNKPVTILFNSKSYSINDIYSTSQNR